MRRQARQRGFLLMDIFVGLAVVIVLGMVVGMSITATGKAVQALADQRRAVREAERALTLLQQGEASNHPIEQLDTTAPSGLTWVRVSVTIESQHAQLVGLVPLVAAGGAP